jgi:hypothetical protein
MLHEFELLCNKVMKIPKHTLVFWFWLKGKKMEGNKITETNE